MKPFHAFMQGLIKGAIIIAKIAAVCIMAVIAFIGVIANSVSK